MRSPYLDAVARTVTWLGDGAVIVFIAAGVCAVLAARGRRIAAASCFVPLLSTPLNWVLKQMMGRPRPDSDVVNVLASAGGLSFPSGHAMGAAWFFGLLSLLAVAHARERRRAACGAAVCAAVILLVGLSRVYLGVHWASDVLGGWASGLALAALTYAATPCVPGKQPG